MAAARAYRQEEPAAVDAETRASEISRAETAAIVARAGELQC